MWSTRGENQRRRLISGPLTAWPDPAPVPACRSALPPVSNRRKQRNSHRQRRRRRRRRSIGLFTTRGLHGEKQWVRSAGHGHDAKHRDTTDDRQRANRYVRHCRTPVRSRRPFSPSRGRLAERVALCEPASKREAGGSLDGSSSGYCVAGGALLRQAAAGVVELFADTR